MPAPVLVFRRKICDVSCSQEGGGESGLMQLECSDEITREGTLQMMPMPMPTVLDRHQCSLTLVGTGTLGGVDPDRIILKKVSMYVCICMCFKV